MNNSTDELMDRLLKQWLGDQHPNQEQLASLRTRILKAAERQRIAQVTEPRRMPQRRLRTAVLGAVAIAASLMLALLLFGLSRGNRDLPPGEGSSFGVCFEQEEILARAQLAARLHEIFPERLAWIAESEGKVELGIGSGTKGADDFRPIAVRFLVRDRVAGQSNWRSTWSADLVLDSEEHVEFKLQDQPGRELTVWAQVLPDGMIAIDSSLQACPSCPEVRYSGVEKSGATQRILRETDAGREVEVYQTVVLLPKDVG